MSNRKPRKFESITWNLAKIKADTMHFEEIQIMTMMMNKAIHATIMMLILHNTIWIEKIGKIIRLKIRNVYVDS